MIGDQAADRLATVGSVEVDQGGWGAGAAIRSARRDERQIRLCHCFLGFGDGTAANMGSWGAVSKQRNPHGTGLTWISDFR